MVAYPSDMSSLTVMGKKNFNCTIWLTQDHARIYNSALLKVSTPGNWPWAMYVVFTGSWKSINNAYKYEDIINIINLSQLLFLKFAKWLILSLSCNLLCGNTWTNCYKFFAPFRERVTHVNVLCSTQSYFSWGMQYVLYHSSTL